MDSIVERFLKKIKCSHIEDFASGNAFFDNLQNIKEANTIKATLVLDRLISIEAYNDLFDCMKRNEEEGLFTTILNFKYQNDDKDALSSFVDEFLNLDIYSPFTSFSIDGDKIVLYYSGIENETDARESSLELKRLLNKINAPYSPIISLTEEPSAPESLTVEVSEESVDETEETIENEELLVDEDYDFYAELAQRYKNEAFESKRYLDEERERYRELEEQNKEYHKVSIHDIEEGLNVEITGKIFAREEKASRKGKLIVNFSYSDGTDSITSILFESKHWTLDKLKQVQVGKNIKVKGTGVIDEFHHQLMVKVRSLTLLPDDKARTDECENKRIELHLHTKMSAMDGVSTITDYAKVAKEMGHVALALTDHGCVQSFPEAQGVAKQFGLKILYGAELYMVDSKLENIFNPKDIVLNGATYIVFDLETTGLSARYDRIIEFGAVKVENGIVMDEIDFFINPDIELSNVTTDLTGITNDMVRNGKSINEAIRVIKNFIGDDILVSHNATFDVGFLNEALKNNGFAHLDNPVVDTLPLSRYIFPKQKSHTLGSVARTLSVEYDESSAHRAIYDAQVLNNVWEAMLSILTSKNQNLKHYELGDLTSRDIIFNTRPVHVTVFCKNSQGMKDLFKIISDSNIEYLGDVPRVPRTLLEQYRENLLIGSACLNGEVFQATMTRSEEVVENKMKFYDFIEVQPPENYSFLVNDGQVASFDHILKIVSDLIKTAKRLNKIVVATGDVHYANPQDKIFRDVYIFAKGLKGARHPLNPYRRDRQKKYKNPDQHYRSTQEMKDAFAFLGDEKLVEEIVVNNTHVVTDMIENIKPIKDKLYTPTIENCAELLEKMVFDKAHDMYGDPLPQVISDRLEAELKGIRENNYYVIYYIASQLVGLANKEGYIVGSRGSVGSSFVATMASITEVNPLAPHYLCPKCKHLEFADPIKYPSGFDLPDKECPHCGHKMTKDGQNIPFATFLGFKAEKVPDIDLNFPRDYQSKAHELTKTLLGADNVYKAGTIETVAEKTAIGYAKGYFEYMYGSSDNVRPSELTRLAIGCRDVKRTTGQHPGGIIVIPANMSVYDFTPIQYPANEVDSAWKTTHFDFHAIHDNVLKLDLLGHVDPMALRMMCDLTGTKVTDIPLHDDKVLSLFTSTKSLNLVTDHLKASNGAMGMPEFGTNFVRQILNETKPKTFADLVIISGLSHGTDVYNGNAQELINSKIATLRDVIGCRDDIMTGLADKYGIDSSDSFKIMELVRKNNFTKPKFAEDREKYEALMKEHGVPQYYIDSCCKIKYLFPKAHAVAYTMMGVRVGWFKVYKPLAYYATYFSVRCDSFDLKTMAMGAEAINKKLQYFNQKKIDTHGKLDNKEASLEGTLNIAMEMVDRGYKFLPISIFKSAATRFVIDEENKALIPPFSALDGLGESVANSIVEAREERMFSSEEDLLTRTRLSNQRLVELRELGSLEGLYATEQISLEDLLNGL